MYDTEVASFVTLVITMIDSRTHELTVATAGHPHVLNRRAGGLVEEIGCDGTRLPLGVSRDATYRVTRVPLQPDDVLVLMYEGVTDAMAHKKPELRADRLRTEPGRSTQGRCRPLRDDFRGRL